MDKKSSEIDKLIQGYLDEIYSLKKEWGNPSSNKATLVDKILSARAGIINKIRIRIN